MAYTNLNITVEREDGTKVPYVYRELTLLESTRLMRALGDNVCQNRQLFGIYNIMSSLREIDGIPMPMPTNIGQMDELVDRVGDDVEQIMEFLNTEAQKREAEKQKKTEAAFRAEVKN